MECFRVVAVGGWHERNVRVPFVVRADVRPARFASLHIWLEPDCVGRVGEELDVHRVAAVGSGGTAALCVRWRRPGRGSAELADAAAILAFEGGGMLAILFVLLLVLLFVVVVGRCDGEEGTAGD